MYLSNVVRKPAGILKNALRSLRKACGVENFYRHNVRPHLRRITPHLKRDSRVKFILTPGYLGPAKKQLAPEIERKIKEHLDNECLGPMRTTPPGVADLIAVPDFKRQAKPVKALIVMQKHINGDPSYVESDLAFHFIHSAQTAGIEVIKFDCDQCTCRIRDGALAQNQLNELQSVIFRENPDLVVFDGNFIGFSEGLNLAWWSAIRQKTRFKLVSVITDCYPPHRDYLSYWTEADLSVVFHRNSVYVQTYPAPKRLLFSPGFPFSKAILDSEAMKNKDFSFCCIGSDYRNRYEFCSQVKKTKLPVKIMLHHRSTGEALSIADYIRTVCHSKIVFNTGFVSNETNIVNFRPTEAILCRALLLEENGAALSDYFMPWRHFIPVTNAHDVAIYSQFFDRNEPYRRRITEDALSFYESHYSSNMFWHTLLSRLELTQ